MNELLDYIEGMEVSPFNKMDALEVFAGMGKSRVRHYYKRFRSFTAWEQKREYKEELKHNLGGADIRICDSYREVTRTDKKFDIIFIDPSIVTGQRIQCFDIFPDIFRLLSGYTYLIITCWTDPRLYVIASLKDKPAEQAKRDKFVMEKMKSFLGHGSFANESDLMIAYKQKLQSFGVEIPWARITPLNADAGVYSLALLVHKGSYMPQPIIKKITKINTGEDYLQFVESIKGERVLLRDYADNLYAGRYYSIRHDVDHDLDRALRMAELEAENGIHSTYFMLDVMSHDNVLLHMPYFDYSEDFGVKLKEFQDMGHEVGWHNNVLTEYFLNGGDIKSLIMKPLDFMRKYVDVVGSAGHGDILCNERKYTTYSVWTECKRKDVGGDVPWLSMSEVGLKYEAYFLPRTIYLSDSDKTWGGGYRGMPEVKGVELKNQCVEYFNSSEVFMQILLHPDAWQD